MSIALRIWLCCGMPLCAASVALADCAVPRSITPAERFSADSRPAIRWSAVEGATAYVLKVQSRVPEGRLVASFDVVVADTQFLPPTSLADERAKVTVSVVARCKDGASAALQMWFLIDATAACPAPAVVRIKRTNGSINADWTPTIGVTNYEVRLHSPLDGRALKVLETREPRALMEGDFPGGAVLSVRPRCAQGFGDAVFGFVTD